MTMPQQQGFSLLELVLVVILVVVLYVVAVDRLLPLRGDAEAAHVATMIGTMKSGLGFEISRRLLQGEDFASLERSNPMRLLNEPPENYLGEVGGLRLEQLPVGHWVFDTDRGELVYLVRYTEYFRTELPGVPRMVFRTELVYNEREDLAGIRLTRINAFVWTRSADITELLEQR